jgi:3-hydroxyisobutyrate dehydrogenase
MARKVNFPTPLCSIAEQVYFSAVDRSWGANDDSGIVRLWTSDAVSSIKCSLSEEEKQHKLSLVVDLLTGIHLCAAAEAISLAHHVGIPLPQLYELACDAAGGSAMFKSVGAKMIAILRGEKSDSVAVLEGYAEKLAGVLNEAQVIKCPLYLGNGALALMLQTGKSKDLASLLGYYSVE